MDGSTGSPGDGARRHNNRERERALSFPCRRKINPERREETLKRERRERSSVWRFTRRRRSRV